MGTIHLLEALRTVEKDCVAIFVTTDKCYENREWIHGYRETDPLGGRDPYSSSKAAAEIAIASWRASFFHEHPVRLASVRAGNVIGGGDWAEDRIVPDAIRALQRGESIPVRNARATRPWQHVLEPLSGYLSLAASLCAAIGKSDRPKTDTLCSAFNFGPELGSNRTVGDLVAEILANWPGGEWTDRSDPRAPHEAGLLNLDTDKAFHLIQWQPAWNFRQTIAESVAWYRQCAAAPAETRKITARQIAEYTSAARARGISWAA